MTGKVYYPCKIKFEDGIYYVQFIDIDEAFTDGETLEEAFIEARDVLESVIFSYVKNGRELPVPSSNISNVAKNEFISYVDIWLDPIVDKVNNSAVKKTLTIPKWLNDMAEGRNINFSSLLQYAIKEELGIRN